MEERPEVLEETAAKDKKPSVWELTVPEIGYPQSILGRTIYVHMKQYEARDLKALQRERGVRMAQGEEFADLRDLGKTEVIAFFWKHFLKLSGPATFKDGKESSSEQHKDWILGHPRFDIERTAVLSGYAGLRPEPTEVSEVSLFDGPDENVVRVYQNVLLPNVGREAVVMMSHFFHPESEQDNQRYRQACGNVRLFTRRSESQVMINYDTLEQLYDSLILHVDGMTINGAPCTESNKSAWVKMIPFWHKDIVLNELFRGASAKNG